MSQLYSTNAQDVRSYMLEHLDSEIAQAFERQNRIARDIEILGARSEAVGGYRVKLMDLRDKIQAAHKMCETETPKQN